MLGARVFFEKKEFAGDFATLLGVQIPLVHYVKARFFLAASFSRYIPIRRLEVSSILNIKTIICPEVRTDWENNYG